MDLSTKIKILADSAKYDASCASSGSSRRAFPSGLGASSSCGLCHSYTPDGRCISLLKILLTNYCVYDCAYCVNRVSNDVPRARFTTQEIVDLTVDFYRRNYIEGLFLSSGVIRTADYTMEQMIDVARTLRTVHRFGGYIHLKAIAGASAELVRLAGLWADRLSANIELPTQTDLDQLAPEKKFTVIEGTMGEIRSRAEESRAERKRSRKAPAFAPAGQSTQLIVGATPSSDTAIIQLASRLYAGYKLRRVYYSGFSPYPQADSRLPLKPPPLVREHRLYQADWLMRYYGFEADEITSPEQPNLDLDRDPKLAWALRHREFFPVDVNRAPREALLRVPGIGHQNVGRILSIRRYHRITLADLAKLRVAMTRVKPFVVTADANSEALKVDRSDLDGLVAVPRQIGLFDAASSALSGEL